MVSAEADGEPDDGRAVNHQGGGQGLLAYGLDEGIPTTLAQVVLKLLAQDAKLAHGGSKHKGIQGAGAGDKGVEEPVVPLAYAVPQPGAMVVKSLDAILAH